MLEDVRRLADIESDVERAREASKLLAALQAGISETSRLRRESIARLREQGHSLADIADIGMRAACPSNARFKALVSMRSFSTVEVPWRFT